MDVFSHSMHDLWPEGTVADVIESSEGSLLMLMHGAVPQPPGNGVWFDIVAVPATDFMEPQISDSHQAASQDPSTEIAENIVATEDPYMTVSDSTPKKTRKKRNSK